MAPYHTHLHAEEWPIKAIVYTRPAEGGLWESRIVCFTSDAVCSQDHYKTIGQYQNHLMKYHRDEVMKFQQQWSAMNNSSQGAPSFMSPGHQGLGYSFNRATRTGNSQRSYMNSANSVLASVERETSITSPASLGFDGSNNTDFLGSFGYSN